MPTRFRTVCVVGLGYVGLPTAAALATHGIDVVGVDVNEHIVDQVNRGDSPFVEPDLAVAVSGAAALGRLRATTVPEPADAYIIAVPTPARADHSADLSAVEAAVRTVAPLLKRGDLVVLESTSPPGTTERLCGWLAAQRPDLRFPRLGCGDVDVNVAYCPERVLPGRIMIEMLLNERIVGGVTARCADRAHDLYRTFVQGEIHLTDAVTAEVVKLSENAYRDVNIAFANELSVVCDQIGVDVRKVIRLANRHPRVGILQPGPGVGGHCIAIDPWFLVEAAPNHSPLLRTARAVNDAKPGYVVRQVCEAAARRSGDPVIACLGLTFKANVDDLRESPSLAIVEELAARDVGMLLVVEPHVTDLPDRIAVTGRAKLTELREALDQADVVVLLVDHDQFREVEPTELQGKSIVDTRGLWR
jgi:UDP-N-acetyl-D-mannosaminuronic acid dehydrogenase